MSAFFLYLTWCWGWGVGLGVGRENEFSGLFLERHRSHPGTSILTTSTLCKPNHLPKIPYLQIPSRGALGLQQMNFGDTQTFSP